MDHLLSIANCVGILLDGLISALIVYALQKYTDGQKELRVKLDAQDGRLKQMAGELVAREFAATAEKLQAIMSDLAIGEQTFKEIAEKRHQTELEIVERLEQVKDNFRDRFATSESLERHQSSMEAKFNSLDDRMREMGENLAALAAVVRTVRTA